MTVSGASGASGASGLRWRVASTVGVGSALVVLAASDPRSSGLFPSCVVHTLTGWECPGCGATRAAHAVIRGDLTGALDLNVLFVVSMPWLIWRYLQWLAGRGGPTSPAPWGLVMALGLVVAAFTVTRNLDVEPLVRLSARV